VYGGGNVGEILVNQNINLIWFIGSSATGKKLFKIAGEKQIKAVLEMGGSNPAIVFDDADIDKAIQHVYNGRFMNAGQVCDAIKRLIIHENIYDKFLIKLTEKIKKLKIGDPLLPSTQMGPLSSLKQKKLLEEQVSDALKLGAKAIIGGNQLPNTTGAYYSPMLLTHINFQMRVWKEEVFGPVLPIVTFKTEEEAIRLANDTPYGLGSAVYSSDIERARRVANLIEAGYVNINDGNRWSVCSNPFGGVKASGMGCEHGRQGFQELCQLKVIAEG
jgi:succinate-semialdehyde dehydrogenase/glutarate-semialdehyde dehydrogenase